MLNTLQSKAGQGAANPGIIELVAEDLGTNSVVLGDLAGDEALTDLNAVGDVEAKLEGFAKKYE